MVDNQILGTLVKSNLALDTRNDYLYDMIKSPANLFNTVNRHFPYFVMGFLVEGTSQKYSTMEGGILDWKIIFMN